MHSLTCVCFLSSPKLSSGEAPGRAPPRVQRGEPGPTWTARARGAGNHLGARGVVAAGSIGVVLDGLGQRNGRNRDFLKVEQDEETCEVHGNLV